MTRSTLVLWKVFWIYAIPVSIVYQILWGQIFSYWSANEWFPQGYQILLISKHASEILFYFFVVYFLVKRTSSASQLAIIASRGFFLILLLLTVNALIIDINTIS